MYSFIVLGLVPGTSFQITFEMWLQCAELLTLTFLLSVLAVRYTNTGRAGVVADIERLRIPVHARQLHR